MGIDASKLTLYHYYEHGLKPFLSLSELGDSEAQRIQDELAKVGDIYKRRDSDGMYLFYRHMIENRMFDMFVGMGGKPDRKTPRYMVIGDVQACRRWYRQAECLTIPLSEFDMSKISFTYGDSFPTFDPSHGDKSEYRQRIYDLNGILEMIEKYGWLQDTPVDENTPYWQPMYVEAQVWCDLPM